MTRALENSYFSPMFREERHRCFGESKELIRGLSRYSKWKFGERGATMWVEYKAAKHRKKHQYFTHRPPDRRGALGRPSQPEKRRFADLGDKPANLMFPCILFYLENISLFCQSMPLPRFRRVATCVYLHTLIGVERVQRLACLKVPLPEDS